MNNITLKGIIKSIQYSHSMRDIDYNKAVLLVKRYNGQEDIINIKFKKFSCPYKENDEVSLIGNIRSYSKKIGNKNNVEIYIFTYLDKPQDEDIINEAILDGRICKKSVLRKTSNGKDVIDFILANNLVNEEQSLNCYIPVVAWGKEAKQINQLEIGTKIQVEGSLQSREYKKRINDNDFEIKVAHELSATKVELLI